MHEKEECEKNLTGFGACLQRFAEAKRMAVAAEKLKWSDVSTLKSTIESEYQLLKKDNDMIYMDPLPAANTLKPIAAIPVSKPTIVQIQDLIHFPSAKEDVDNSRTSQLVNTYRPIMERLLPISVRQNVQEYNLRAESLLSAVEHENKQINASVAEELQTMNLPFCLRASPEGISDELWEKVAEVNAKGKEVNAKGKEYITFNYIRFNYIRDSWFAVQ
jgi:programmed cell death 6-interacting protein